MSGAERWGVGFEKRPQVRGQLWVLMGTGAVCGMEHQLRYGSPRQSSGVRRGVTESTPDPGDRVLS